jgi:hypothetical protein
MAQPIGPEEVSYFETASPGYIEKKADFDRYLVLIATHLTSNQHMAHLWTMMNWNNTVCQWCNGVIGGS